MTMKIKVLFSSSHSNYVSKREYSNFEHLKYRLPCWKPRKRVNSWKYILSLNSACDFYYSKILLTQSLSRYISIRHRIGSKSVFSFFPNAFNQTSSHRNFLRQTVSFDVYIGSIKILKSPRCLYISLRLNKRETHELVEHRKFHSQSKVSLFSTDMLFVALWFILRGDLF